MDDHSQVSENRGLSRRTVIKGGGALVVGGGIAGIPGVASAQDSNSAGVTASDEVTADNLFPEEFSHVEGTGGGAVPLRASGGQLDFLDPNEYIHNMEVVSHLEGVRIRGGEPLMNMWAEGSERLIGARGGWVDVTDPLNPVFRSAQVSPNLVIYNEKLKKWLMITSHQRPIVNPTPEFPRGKYHEEYAAVARNFNGFLGIRVYDASDPTDIQLLSEFNTGETGHGTHHNFYDGGRYAYLDCGFDDTLRMESSERILSNGVMIVDMSDPADVKEVSRWWVPGQRIGEEEEYFKYDFSNDQSSWTGNHGAMTVPQRVEDGGTVGYAGFGQFGMFVHDLSNIEDPQVHGVFRHQLEAMGGIPYHTVYPPVVKRGHPRLRNTVIGVFEALEIDGREPWHTSYVIDVKDPSNPKLLGMFPRPEAPPDAPYAHFWQARGRFSSHNIQAWVAPGRMRPEIVAFSYFSAGLRLYDISDPTEPRETAYWVPARTGDFSDFDSWRRGTTETVFIEWDRNLIWVGTTAGTTCLTSPALGEPVLEPRPVTEWSVPHVNRTPHVTHPPRGRGRARG